MNTEIQGYYFNDGYAVLPDGYEILKIGYLHGQLRFWAMVDPKAGTSKVYIKVLKDYEYCSYLDKLKYLNSPVDKNDVRHIFIIPQTYLDSLNADEIEKVI